MRTDIYAELYVWNKNANAMSRVLERLRLVGTYPKPQLEALQRRLEELCAELNVQILEDLLVREQHDYSRIAELRQTIEGAKSEDFVH